MRKVLLFAVTLFISLCVYAQEETVVELQGQKGPYVTNGFLDNWFVSAGGGVQVYFGKNDTYGDFGKRIAPAFDVSLGKWFTPCIGTRLQFAGIKAKGWTNKNLPYIDGRADSKGYYKEKYNIMNLHGDFLFNISNAIGGQNMERFWTFVPFGGFGWARTWENDTHKNELALSLGLLHYLRLTDAIDVNIEMRSMLVNQRLVYSTGNHGVNVLGTITAGITYKFNQRGFKRAADLIVVEDNTQYINTIQNLEKMLDQSKAKREQLARELANERANKREQYTETPVFPDYAIFFEINTANITEKSMVNIGYMADLIKKSPDKQFTLYASADKETGTPEYNQQLSQKRGEAVYNALVEKFGVDPEQLSIEAVGSSEQRFDGAQLNRVVIIQNN